MDVRRAWCLAIALAISVPIYGQQVENQGQGPEQQAADATARGTIEGMKGVLDVPLYDEAMKVLDALLKTARADQEAVYLFVRSINRNIDALTRADACKAEKKKCEDFETEIRKINHKLMKASYTDPLFQNKHLSYQIKTRMPLLIADSLKLHEDNSAARRKDFEDELRLLSDRFLSARRFRAGIGLSYSYLPTLTYQASPRVDFSPFQTASSGGADTVLFNTELSDRSVRALALSAKVPWVQLDVSIPDLKHTQTTTTTVQQRPGDADNDLLARTTIDSELRVEYDASVNVCVMDVVNWFREVYDKPTRNYQFDFGFGVGMTGLEIKDSVSTDVRFRTNPASTFNDLPPGAMITSGETNTFNAVFGSVHASFRISDEIQVGVQTRFYEKDRVSDSEIDVDGVTISLSALWYPTFPW